MTLAASLTGLRTEELCCGPMPAPHGRCRSSMRLPSGSATNAIRTPASGDGPGGMTGRAPRATARSNPSSRSVIGPDGRDEAGLAPGSGRKLVKQVCRVTQREIRAQAERREHGVGGVADQRHPRGLPRRCRLQVAEGDHEDPEPQLTSGWGLTPQLDTGAGLVRYVLEQGVG